MAILLLCAMQPDSSGWRRQIDASIAESVDAVGQAVPQASSAFEQGVEPLLDKAGRMLETGVSEAESVLEHTRDEAVDRVRGLLSESQAVGATGADNPTGWTEIERALADPAGERGGTVRTHQPTLRNRMRRAEASAEMPLLPPDYGSAIDDARGRTSAADAPGPLRSSDEPSLRVSQSLDRAGNLDPQEPGNIESDDDGLPVSGRELIYEADAQTGPIRRQRYLSPPPREGDLVARQVSGQDVRSADSRQQAGSGQVEEGSFALPNPPAESSVTRTDPPREATGDAPAAQAVEKAVTRPWGPLVLAVLALFGSLGLNLYLGWIAWDLYSRHQDAVDDIHELEAKLEAKQQELATSAGPRLVARGSLVR